MEIGSSKFHPRDLIKSPTLILRSISLIFSLIVLSCLARDGYIMGQCILQSNGAGCSLGIAVSVIAVLLCLVFAIVDVIFHRIAQQIVCKRIAALDTGISASWTFMYFVAFCYMTNQWQRTDAPQKLLLLANLNNVRASITFAFFSILVWGGLTYAAFLRYRACNTFAINAGDVLDTHSGPYFNDYEQHPDPSSFTYPTTYENSADSFEVSKFVSGNAGYDTDLLAG